MQRKRLPRELVVFLVLSIVFTALSLLHAGILSLRHHNWLGFSLLWPPGPGFDFYAHLERMRLLHSSSFFTYPGYQWYYPAPAVIVYWLLYLFCFGGHWQWGFVIYAAVILTGCLFFSRRFDAALAQRGIRPRTARDFTSITLLTSWPLFISLQRGNLEGILWLVLAVAIWAIVKDRWMLAAIILGLAAAVKIYPVLCFALFLRGRRWKEIAAGLFAMGCVTLFALRFMEPNVLEAMHHVSKGVGAFTYDYALLGWQAQMVYDHSCFELIKIFSSPFHLAFAPLVHRYMAIMAVAMSLIFFARVLWLPKVNQVLFLIIACLFLPPASFDYTLQSLYIPFAWIVLVFVSDPKANKSWSMITTILFAVETAPLTFLSLHGLSIAGAVKGVVTCPRKSRPIKAGVLS